MATSNAPPPVVKRKADDITTSPPSPLTEYVVLIQCIFKEGKRGGMSFLDSVIAVTDNNVGHAAFIKRMDSLGLHKELRFTGEYHEFLKEGEPAIGRMFEFVELNQSIAMEAWMKLEMPGMPMMLSALKGGEAEEDLRKLPTNFAALYIISRTLSGYLKMQEILNADSDDDDDEANKSKRARHD